MPMKDRRVSQLDPAGFNELSVCKSGPMVYNRNDIYVGGSLAKYGEFSVGEQEIFEQIVRPGFIVVEVGANLGGHTVVLSRLVGPQGEVHAFEPQRIVFQTLCANLALNQCTNVFATQAGVGASLGTILVPAIDPAVHFNYGGLSLRDSKFGETVPLVTLDSVNLIGCHLLKVDVEGMEVEVLTGGRETIMTFRPLMYLENDRVDRSEELLTLVDRLGYRAYWHFPRLFNPANFAGDPDDIFPGIRSINIFCVPRELSMDVGGMRAVASAKETWQTAIRAIE
jgi:FkbM family methyltransferase